MTEIQFHTKVPDVSGYVCRLLRKAVRKGARVVVTAEPALLKQLDLVLWTSDPLDFLPHLRLQPGAAVAPRFAETPVWLAESGLDAPVHEVLVNLAPEPARGFESFERVIEVVGRDEAAVQAGRLRWRHYLERGYRLAHHEASAD